LNQNACFADFNGGTAYRNRQSKTGINTSNKVAKMVKGAGEVWAEVNLNWLHRQTFLTTKKNISK
jgi:hypothetical protein